MEERIVDPIPCNKSWNDRFLGGQQMWLFQLSYAGQGHMEGCLWSLIDWLRIDSSACLYQSLPWEGRLQHLSRPEMRRGDTYSFATPLPHTLVPPPALYQQNAASQLSLMPSWAQPIHFRCLKKSFSCFTNGALCVPPLTNSLFLGEEKYRYFFTNTFIFFIVYVNINGFNFLLNWKLLLNVLS